MADIGGIHFHDLREYLFLLEAMEAVQAKRVAAGLLFSDAELEVIRKVSLLTKLETKARRAKPVARNPRTSSSAASGEIVDVEYAAQAIGITPQAIRRSCATGRLDAGQAGDKSWWITRVSVDRLAYEKKGSK